MYLSQKSQQKTSAALVVLMLKQERRLYQKSHKVYPISRGRIGLFIRQGSVIQSLSVIEIDRMKH